MIPMSRMAVLAPLLALLACSDAKKDPGPDACVPGCGASELCAVGGIAADDDCDGQVDEGCSCTPGQAQGCFAGDPSYLDAPGCFPGVQFCDDAGGWGACLGGVHASDGCQAAPAGCHALTTHPFGTVALTDGIGTFGADALAESFAVACPDGTGTCPAVGAGDQFRPLASGEYTVTYSKTTATGSDGCTFPLFVGARGLRVELDWEHGVEGAGDMGVDLDLHLHRPGNTQPWGGDVGTAADCAWDNCTISAFEFGSGVDWFNGVAPPDPVDWYLSPIPEENGCYDAPRGAGARWEALALGCHNPRLDLDTITCDPTVTDPDATSFCAPENGNVDFPPRDAWTRIGVHYYSAAGKTYDVHPGVKIWCDGVLAARLGPGGFAAPVTFAPADGGSRFWLVADVAFHADGCGTVRCVVEPLLLGAFPRTPYLTTVPVVQASMGPPYPPLP